MPFTKSQQALLKKCTSYTAKQLRAPPLAWFLVGGNNLDCLARQVKLSVIVYCYEP